MISAADGFRQKSKLGCHWTKEKFYRGSDYVVCVVLFRVVQARMVAAM